MENNRFERCLLLDFYGELLTEKQRRCCDLHFNEDLSLGEIAEQLGISRQGVWDNIRRGESTLQEIETKIGLIRRFLQTRAQLDGVSAKLDRLIALSSGEAETLAKEIADEVQKMKRES